MGTDVFTPGTLERISLWGVQRVCRLRWQYDRAEWVFALRWFRWSILLEVNGYPGDVRGCGAGFLWQRDAACRRLRRAVLRPLVRKGLLRLQGRQAEADGDSPDFWRYVKSLWRWLDRQTPDGYPPD